MSNISTRSPLQTPNYEQEQPNSCLPACVRMLLSFLGIEKSESQIRKLLKTRSAGTNPLSVTNLRVWNLEAVVSFSNLEELQTYLRQEKPIIALLWTAELSHWDSKKYFDYLHAVVVIGFDDENILVNDPAFSGHPQKIMLDEFLEAWSYSQQMLILVEKS